MSVIRRRLPVVGLACALLVFIAGCAGSSGTRHTPAAESELAPVAAIHPYPISSPNGTRTDNYYWVRDDTRTKPEVLDYLKAENAYYEASMAHAKPLEDKLFDEIVGRIQQDDSTVPAKYRGCWYYTRYVAGQEYPLYARRCGKPEASEQLLLDGNALASGHDFYQIGASVISPDGKLLAWADDTVGRRQFTVRIKKVATGEVLGDEFPNTSAAVAWADDGKTLFYVENDPVTLLTTRVKKHVLGTPAANDAVVYEEPDHSYYIDVRRSSDDRYVLIEEESTLTTEMRFVAAARPNAHFTVFEPRQRNLEYHADHIGKRWIVRDNWQAKNFRLHEVADARVGDKQRWRDLVRPSDEVLISDFALFRGYLVISERSDGLQRVRVHAWSGGKESFVKSDEADYVATLGDNREQDTDVLRYDYSSLATPTTVYDLNMRTGARVQRKRDAVLGGFDPANYVTERAWAPARDGARIPVSLVYRRGMEKNRSAPLLQIGYGSYGISSDPYFRSERLSLVDRGFVIAIAHVRGGQEMGRSWYEDGKLQKKRNTFTDFIDVTEYLVREGWVAKDKVFAEGGSAGGLLMGAVANLAPQDYRAIVAHVPFVDVVTTMLDESIPLTTNEFDEWGNPKEKASYDYMLAYSPYDNVSAQAYPAMFVTTGLWDSQVQYYEPTKWVAKLRALKTDHNPLLFKVNMEAGHGGKSGRFRRYREVAEVYAFVLDQIGPESGTAASAPAR